ncbi:xanthine dehydrogenase family protein [Bradyrhizobium sp. KBS0727]|uniref:xanthine dehydrogenase family protein molybdopterin-binding subunit n=1 Tax=Bradyrhizobium sp. KBS0727 TaxID=2578114 RepID=UPI00110D99D0|nr:xanthine dehydrogenase family protein molybdopterin-binding subunit [Bradyrhizobium sp. KBS0727]QDW40573.1 xanthine dehydrogenase family protein [Bradyrhizobium sp. KBS0725]QDW47178.1 xanthine dehydrogenase family protein [Bradyrhizobium sp. KBS0727]
MLGLSVERKEDDRFLTGQGQYVEDVKLPGMAYAAFVRSSHAHAFIRKITTDAALSCPGVLAIVGPGTWKELSAALPSIGGIQGAANPYGGDSSGPVHKILSDHATHVGEVVAVVIAKSPYSAADGADLVEVEYEALPVVTWEEAASPGSVRLHEGYDNVVARMNFEVGDVDEAFRQADRIITKRFDLQSLKAMAIECRGIAVQWDASTGTLNVWSTTQAPYSMRETIARVLDLPIKQVRVICRDIGGGFGLKGGLKPEDLIVAIAAYKLKKPIRWIETRLEHMISSNQSGRQSHDVRVGIKRDGTILCMDLILRKEVGAYNHYQTMLPSNTINHLTTHYKIPAFRFDSQSIATNTVPCCPYRGAGRVEAVFTMDRILDAIARELTIDPVEARRRNIIEAADMPYKSGLIYRDGVPINYKDLDFPLLLERALTKSDYWGWRNRQMDLRQAGRCIGIGISSYVEAGGMGPSETATVQIDYRGHAQVSIGVNSQGQSHETTLAQICGSALGLALDEVFVRGGDTNLQDFGFGTGASRVAINTGNAVYKAALDLRHKIVTFASRLFECAATELDVTDGVVSVKAPGQQFMTFAELAQKSVRDRRMADLGGPGLASTASFYPPTVTWSSGVNIAVVEIDRNTGRIHVLKYVFVHDSGKPLNPAVVEGQICGGLAQGFGIALGERMIYDSEGQALSGSMMDYFVPRASDIPDIDLDHVIFPTDDNPLGIKSVGESGPNSPPAAIAAAVADAFEGRLEISSLPISWGDVLKSLQNGFHAGRVPSESETQSAYKEDTR